MSRLSDFLRRARIPRIHQTRRYLAREIAKHGFQVGDYSYGRPDVFRALGCRSRLLIGSFCSIAPGVKILLGADHRTDWISTFPFHGAGGWSGVGSREQIVSRGDIVIGSDVWIGANATILSGISIGHGAVIGAGSVVVSDIPPYAVAVGNPARVMRKRFSDEVAKQLLALEWWNLPHGRIREIVPLLQSTEPARLIGAISPAK